MKRRRDVSSEETDECNRVIAGRRTTNKISEYTFKIQSSREKSLQSVN